LTYYQNKPSQEKCPMLITETVQLRFISISNKENIMNSNQKTQASNKPIQKLSVEAKKFLSQRNNNGGGGHCQGGGGNNW